MKVDKKDFKALKKEGGGIFKQKFVIPVYHEFGLDEKVGCSGVLTMLDNGLFFDITFGNKYYFPTQNIKEVTRKNGKLGIETDEENIILRPDNEQNLEKAYKEICNALGLEMTKTDKQVLFEKIMSSNPEVAEKATEDNNNKAEEKDKVCCPKCHSTNVQYIDKNLQTLAALKEKGGIFASIANLGTNVDFGNLRCLNCGYSWKLKYKKKK